MFPSGKGENPAERMIDNGPYGSTYDRRVERRIDARFRARLAGHPDPAGDTTDVRFL